MSRTSDSNIGLVTFGLSGEKKDSRSYCASCEKVGINSQLRHRIYLDEQGKITSHQSDAKMWRQCHTCGEIVPIYQAKVQTENETLTEPRPTGFGFNNASSDSEHAEEAIQLDESRLAQHRRKKKQQDLEQYKELDIKDALRIGGKLISYEEHL